MKKLSLSFLFTILLFSSFSNAYLTDEDSQNINYSEEAPNTITINKEALENFMLEFAKLKNEVANPQTARYMKVPFPARPQSNLEQATYYSKALLNQIKTIGIFTLDKADKLTSKKSVIAFFVLAGPFIALYCTYFDINPLRELIGSLFYHSADATTSVGMKALEKTGKGILDAAMENPITTVEVIGGAGVLYTGGVMFKQTVKVMAEDAAPHISKAMATAGTKCLALFALIFNGARYRVSL